MRTLIVLLSSVLTACGGAVFYGGGDKVYQRNGTDMLILCANGGFVATVAGSGALEGRYTPGSPGIATRGDNNAVAFDLIPNSDGTATTPQLGDAPWQPMSLNKAELDHANIECLDLENRTWWTTH